MKDRAERARKADTPWRAWRERKVPVRLSGDDQNASRQRKALDKMSALELECGLTEAEYDAFHAEQRARVLRRYGVTS